MQFFQKKAKQGRTREQGENVQNYTKWIFFAVFEKDTFTLTLLITRMKGLHNALIIYEMKQICHS